jgi:lipid-A-disaccharide synthase
MLIERNPDWTIHTLGGPHLGRTVNGMWIGDTSHCSGIGILSAAQIYPRGVLLSLRLRRFIKANPIDAVVMTDWGYFNCAQLKFLRKQGVPVLYYFPPRSWQRTGNAGLGIARWVARVATPFEWSARRLTAAGCDAEWVGHPLIEQRDGARDRAALRSEFGASERDPLIALFPGSRKPELRVLAPHLAKAAGILRLKMKARFVAAVPGEYAALARKYFPAWVTVVPNRSIDALLACDTAIVKTGTATLEAAVLGAPQVAVYDVDPLRHIEWLALWAWKRIPFIAMPNLILQRTAVPELIGADCKPEAIAFAVEELLTNEVQREQMCVDYAAICHALGADLPQTPTERTAEIIEEMTGVREHTTADSHEQAG